MTKKGEQSGSVTFHLFFFLDNPAIYCSQVPPTNAAQPPPPHFSFLPTCNFDGASLMPLVWHTVKIFLITTSKSLRLFPQPKTSSAFLKQDDVFLISGLVERSK